MIVEGSISTKLMSLMNALKQIYKLRFILGGTALIFCFLPLGQSFANNLTIDSGAVIIDDQDSVNQTARIGFELSWNNSWRNEVNYDAVWVFAKYSTDSGSTWHHAYLSTTGSDHTCDPPYEVKVGTSTVGGNTRGIGAFIQRNSAGAGQVSAAFVGLKWNWGQNGLSATTSARVKVYAIEMVYVPAGGFYIGDGASPGAFCTLSSTTPALIGTSLTRNISVERTAPGDDSQLTDSGIGIGGSGVWSGLDTNNDGTIDNASFPTGYNPFYMMKYEITEGQWVDFFNSLTDAQKSARDITGINGKNSQSTVYRNTIAWPGSGSATTTRSDRVCNYLSWADLCAYADWAGLRPMTELEFEKASRGASSTLANQTVFGTTAVTSAQTISGSENGTETVSGGGDAVFAVYQLAGGFSPAVYSGGDGGTGPLRAGIFSVSNSTRAVAGAGYYGNMELAGNVYERSVSVGNTTNRAFEGTHGDGSLTTNGYGTNTDWPGYVSGSGVASDLSGGDRGGSGETSLWTSTGGVFYLTGLSTRFYPGSEDGKAVTPSPQWLGGRFVRSYP